MQEPRKSARSHRPPVHLDNWSKSAKDQVSDVDTIKTQKKLLKYPNKEKWLYAPDSELVFLLSMDTWTLVLRPSKRKIIKSKWVVKVKCCVDNYILKLKAQIVAMVFSQVEGIDYTEFFTPKT